MHSVLAIASVTLKDALRKKVLFTILFFAVLLTVTAAFLPAARPDDQIRQTIKVSLAGIGFFGMIVAIFLSAPSLPDDISKKTIFSVLTKPARRSEILAGKILGLGYVLAIMLVVMGALSFAYVSFWAWKTGPSEGGLPRLQGNKASWALSVDYHGLTMDLTRPMIESKRAIASGLDRITFHFSGLGGERYLGDTVYAQVTLFSHNYSYDPVTKEGTCAIDVTNPTTGETRAIVFAAEMLHPSYLGFTRTMIDKDGRLDVTVIRHVPAGSFSAMASSVAILSQPSGFGMNFLKALALMFVQYMVLVFIAVSASTVLTSTVSNIFALFVYFTGSLTEVLRDQALALGAEANIFTMAEHTHGAEAARTTVFQFYTNIVLRYFYLGISVLFPNLSYYDMSTAVSNNEYISPASVLDGLWYGAAYAAAMFIIAWMIFRRKEVA